MRHRAGSEALCGVRSEHAAASVQSTLSRQFKALYSVRSRHPAASGQSTLPRQFKALYSVRSRHPAASGQSTLPRQFASALFLQGKTVDAIREARRVVDAAPGHAQAQNLLGAACATLGRRDCTLAAFEASIRANPRDPSTYVNLGMFHLQSADPQSASGAFAEALAVDPMSAGARRRSRAGAIASRRESTIAEATFQKSEDP
jgi:Flp pilus assembly protein TadD